MVPQAHIVKCLFRQILSMCIEEDTVKFCKPKDVDRYCEHALILWAGATQVAFAVSGDTR